MREAADILMRNMSPSKLVRFWAAWQMGEGDYLRWREEVFGHLSVSQLYKEIQAFQASEADHDTTEVT